MKNIMTILAAVCFSISVCAQGNIATKEPPTPPVKKKSIPPQVKDSAKNLKDTIKTKPEKSPQK